MLTSLDCSCAWLSPGCWVIAKMSTQQYTVLSVAPPAALALETASMRLYCEERADDPEALLSAFGLSAVGGVLAFLLLVVELRVVALTSALSLSVAGTFKEMLTVIASVLILGEMPTLDKALGLLLCLLGTAVYTRIVHTSGG